MVLLQLLSSSSVSPSSHFHHHTDGLVQERRNSIANQMELHLFCSNPLISNVELSACSIQWGWQKLSQIIPTWAPKAFWWHKQCIFYNWFIDGSNEIHKNKLSNTCIKNFTKLTFEYRSLLSKFHITYPDSQIYISKVCHMDEFKHNLKHKYHNVIGISSQYMCQ